LSNVVQAVSVSPPHDLMLQQMGLKAISGPPEIGVPSSGLFAADRLIKEHPQILRRTIQAALRANRFIEENREETIRIMTRFVPQSPETAARSYDVEFKALAKDGQMTDAEIEFQMEPLAEKRRPLDEIRDFSFARQALKEIESNKYASPCDLDIYPGYEPRFSCPLLSCRKAWLKRKHKKSGSLIRAAATR